MQRAKAAIPEQSNRHTPFGSRGGVVGTACRDRRRVQLGRPEAVRACQPATGGDKAEAETVRGPSQESEGVIVVLKRGNARGAKDPWLFFAGREGKHRRPENRRRLYVERQTENVTTEGAETA